MKSLAILFFTLSLINTPLFFIYYNHTENNDISEEKQLFYYFSFGNMASFDRICGTSYLDHNLAVLRQKTDSHMKPVLWTAPDEIIYRDLIYDDKGQEK